MYVYMALRQQYRGTSGTKRAAETTRSGWSSGLATLMMGLQRRANGRAMIQWFSSLPCYLTANHRARAAKSNVSERVNNGCNENLLSNVGRINAKTARVESLIVAGI
jgi:hypothetical protein